MKLFSRHIGLIFILTLLIGCSEDKIIITGKGTITGKVVSKGDNLPLENTRISTNPSTSIVFTNASGEYVINNVDVGTYSIEARKDGFLSKIESITVTENNDTNAIFELSIETANNNAPNASILNTPVNNAINQNLSLELAWIGSDPESDNLTYEVKIFNDKNSNVLTYSNLTTNTLTVSGLNYGTKYFWQVAASDAINAAVLSETFNFRTLEFPDNRTFFTRKINGNNVIFSIDDVGNEYQLTSSNNNSWRPRKAINLNSIAFLRTNGSKTHLYTMNLDGSNITQVTNAVAVNGFNLDEIDFSWKSNNTKLIFPNFNTLYEISINGTGLNKIHETLNGNFITEVHWNENTQRIAVKTNNSVGYNSEIYTINTSGSIIKYVLQNINGAAGGIDLSFDGSKLLYTYDVSGNQNGEFRQLNSHIFVYDINASTTIDLSTFKIDGTNDLDPRFSPTDTGIIFVNTLNDGISQQNILKLNFSDLKIRNLFVPNGKMPEWQ